MYEIESPKSAKYVARAEVCVGVWGREGEQLFATYGVTGALQCNTVGRWSSSHADISQVCLLVLVSLCNHTSAQICADGA